ncbi:unnamed protein product [Chondrus crispus]|uniref:Uncharacterized protein n=1 Tax=Chondrus crispus TaxID=2769 RepID=R7QIJ6_CHOCR|nr:unnamed protein product [Chondrus crispus]CDF37894.1 unnamed protein product [Chondrus crispus]|eukprot:XP_005717765.1 unnamed protein product [Chondrus crispus]
MCRGIHFKKVVVKTVEPTAHVLGSASCHALVRRKQVEDRSTYTCARIRLHRAIKDTVIHVPLRRVRCGSISEAPIATLFFQAYSPL